MSNIQKTHRIVMIIGVLSILFSIISALLGNPFKEYAFGLLIGAILVGVAYINNKDWKKDEE
ncbi:hypothetical protein [Ekhidna sp.]